MELAPKLVQASMTPRARIHACVLPLFLLISSLFSFCNHFGFSSSWCYFCTLVLPFTFSLLIPGLTHPQCLPFVIHSLALLYTARPNSWTHCLALLSRPVLPNRELAKGGSAIMSCCQQRARAMKLRYVAWWWRSRE